MRAIANVAGLAWLLVSCGASGGLDSDGWRGGSCGLGQLETHGPYRVTAAPPDAGALLGEALWFTTGQISAEYTVDDLRYRTVWDVESVNR